MADITSEINSILNILETISLAEQAQNLYPVFQRPIDKHAGIRISGKFRTTDILGSMSYITVNRHSNAAIPHDGYGIAWRIGDGTKYNVYIVDNDGLSETVYFPQETVVDASGGVNQFLAAGKKAIVSNTNYVFRINIYDYNGMDVWIYPETAEGTYTIEDRVVYRGQTYPAYMPQSSGEHFGISVAGTRNYEWFYDNLEIINISEIYPMHLFKIKTDSINFPEGEEFSFKYKGVAGLLNDSTSTLKGYIYNYTLGEWEEAISHENFSYTTLNELELEKSFDDIADYLDNSDYVNVLVTPYNYTDDTHALRTYYVSLSNSRPTGYHSGGMVDIYINDYDNISVGSVIVTMSGNELYLKNIPEINMPVVDVISVVRNVTGTSLEEDVEYTVVRENESLAFSTEDLIKIVTVDSEYDGVELKIIYRYYSNGATMQELVNSDTYRYPGVHNLIKTKAPSIISVNTLQYKGSVEETVLRNYIIDYINSLTYEQSFEVSDFINFLYSKGVTYVNLVTLSISVKEYTYRGIYVYKTISNIYNLANKLNMYYADEQSIIGITRAN